MEGRFLTLLEEEKPTLQLRQRLASVSLACYRIFLQVEMIHELGSPPLSFCS